MHYIEIFNNGTGGTGGICLLSFQIVRNIKSPAISVFSHVN